MLVYKLFLAKISYDKNGQKFFENSPFKYFCDDISVYCNMIQSSCMITTTYTKINYNKSGPNNKIYHSNATFIGLINDSSSNTLATSMHNVSPYEDEEGNSLDNKGDLLEDSYMVYA